MKWISVPLVLSLLPMLVVSAAGAPAHAAAPAGNRKVDAPRLLGLAQTGLSGMNRAARAAGGRLDPVSPAQRPFWTALDKMSTALGEVRAGLGARNASFYRALEEGSADLAALRVAWARTGVPEATVSAGLRILSSSYQLLRSGYGREAVRHRQGTGLTPEERQRFLRIQQAQERFARSLRELEESARRRGDEAMQAELRRMAEEAQRIAAARLTLEAYLNALMIGDAQRGEWTANSQYASTDDREEWLEAGAVVEEMYVEEDVGQILMLDLGNLQGPQGPASGAAGSITTLMPSGGSYLDDPIELPDELAEAADTWFPEPYAAPDETLGDSDDVDPLEEEEALAGEEMTDESGEDSDLAMYEDLSEEGEDAETADSETAEEAAVQEGKPAGEAVELPAEAGEAGEAAEADDDIVILETGDIVTLETVEILETGEAVETGPADPAGAEDVEGTGTEAAAPPAAEKPPA